MLDLIEIFLIYPESSPASQRDLRRSFAGLFAIGQPYMVGEPPAEAVMQLTEKER